MAGSRAPHFFRQCDQAIREEVPIVRESARDKEFAVQDWVRGRLDDAGLGYVESGRNTYPDFPLTGDPLEGFEVKSLAHPGRDASYDANSQPPAASTTGASCSTSSCVTQRRVAAPTGCTTWSSATETS
jgi:hypothetical protein